MRVWSREKAINKVLEEVYNQSREQHLVYLSYVERLVWLSVHRCIPRIESELL